MFNKPYFGGYLLATSGFLISEKGSLYFEHTDRRYDPLFAFDNPNFPGYNEYLYTKYKFLSPSSAYYESYTLVPKGLVYGNVFVESEGGELGVLLRFTNSPTDVYCVLYPEQSYFEDTPYDSYSGSGFNVKKSYLFSPDEIYNPYLKKDYDGSYIINSPYVIDEIGDSCDYNNLADISNQGVQIAVMSPDFFSKARETCPDNHYFRFQTMSGTDTVDLQNISCQPCPEGTRIDRYTNQCNSLSFARIYLANS